MTEYKNPFTLDGRVGFQPGVSKKKIEATKRLMDGALAGNRQAVGTLQEAMTTSDAIFNFAHVINLNFVPDFEKAPRTWKEIAGVRKASDFRDVTLYSLARNWSDGVLGAGDPAHVSPVVPEGTAYPTAYMQGEQVSGAHIRKRGFKTDFTFEAMINDPVGFIAALPDAMLEVALDTEEYEVYAALRNGLTTDNEIVAGTNPDGSAAPAKSKLTRGALIQALIQLGQREHNGRKIPANGAYKLIVAPGMAEFANFVLNNVSLTEIKEGTDITLGVSGYNPLARIKAIESEYFDGDEWALVPAGGKVGPRPVLEHLNLIGHEAPELRVENATGNYVGGAAVAPFEGSFVNDSTSFRIRQLGDGVLWTPQAVIWSDGSGN